MASSSTDSASPTPSTDENPLSTGSGRPLVLTRLGYVAIIGLVVSFTLGWFTVSMIESFGPSDSQEGRVLDRFEGETEVRQCTSRASCVTTTYPTYTVIGERVDGSTWLAVGEGPYEASRGHDGQLFDVTTSTVTGRVIGIGDEWTSVGGGLMWLSLIAVVLGLGCIVSVELARRRGRLTFGEIPLRELTVAIPAVAIGLAIAWFALFSKAHGLEVVTSADRFGGFIDDPIAFVSEEPEPAGERNPIPTGRWMGTISEVVVVGSDDLAADVSEPLLPVGDLLAVPMMQEDSVGPANRVDIRLVPEGAFFVDGAEPVDCPATLAPFGGSGNLRGFVCFDAADESGATLQISIQSFGRIYDAPRTAAYDPLYVDS
ncbi:MAG: hypothetical protein AB8G26_05600 [Ilumatobacter sp.]